MRKLFAVALTLIMICSLLPTAALAEETTPTQTPFALHGIQIYTRKEQGKGTYGNWDTHDGLTIVEAGPDGEKHDAVSVPYIPGEEKVLLFEPVDKTVTLTTYGSLQGKITFTKEESTGIYELALPATVTDGGSIWIQLGNEPNTAVDLDILFEPVGNQGGGNDPGNDPGNDRDIVEYYTESRCSKIVVEIFPGVEKVLDFPAPGSVLEDNTLRLTVKSTNPEDWKPLLHRGDDAFRVPYTIEAINPPEGFSGEPKVAVNGGSTLEDALTNLRNNLPNAQFKGYHEDNRARHDAAQYAWRSSTVGGVTRIIPQTETVARAWYWRYGESATFDQTDCFATQVVLAEGVSDMITVTEETHPAVDPARIALISYSNLDKVLSFEEYQNGAFAYREGQEGVLTYKYVDEDKTNVAKTIYDAAALHGFQKDGNGMLHYDLLTVATPAAGYVAKEVQHSRYFTQKDGFDKGGTEAALHFHWNGAYEDSTFTLTWRDADLNDGKDLPDIVEQVTISMPDPTHSGPWMAHAVIDRNPYTAEPVDYDRLAFDSLDGVKGVTSHAYDEATGVLFTTYDNNSIVDTAPIQAATFSVRAPNGAESFSWLLGYDGASNPAYNSFNAWKSVFFWQDTTNREPQPIPENRIAIQKPIAALLKQSLGEEIEYFYSADETTRFLLIQWNFPNAQPLYEYLQLDTSSYYCQWKEDVKADSDVTDAVEKPTAVNDAWANSDIQLVANIHAQTTAKKFFFELEMVEKGSGNTVTEFDGQRFTIILPYEFMGTDPNGDPWRYETAVKMKEAKILHFDQDFTLKDNQGVIFGTFTPRGIEFVVDSFSPFMLELEEKQVSPPSNTPSYGGGGGGGSSSSTTQKNPDGSTTTTTTDKSTGTVTETTTNTDGSTTTVETAKDGTVTEANKSAEGTVSLSVSVSTEAITKDAAQSEGELTIQAEAPKGETAAEVLVSIPVEAVSAVTEAGLEAVVIQSENGSVSVPTEVLADIAEAAGEDKTVSISMETVAPAAVAEKVAEVATAAAMETAVIVEVKISVGGTSVTSFGGNSLKIDVPVTGGKHDEGKYYKVIVISSDGTVEVSNGYCTADGTMRVKTKHLSTFIVTDEEVSPFTDVTADKYYYNAVAWAAQREITGGTSDTTFSPYAACTRAQMVTFLWRAAGSPQPAAATCPFTDVVLDSYYGKAVLWAVESGITTGTTDTTFSPHAPCTRGQMAVFLYRAAKAVPSGDPIPFVDVKAGSYCAEAVQWAYTQTITNGTSATTYSPNSTCTRGQIVTFLYNYYVSLTD